jgi:hypothetical protein
MAEACSGFSSSGADSIYKRGGGGEAKIISLGTDSPRKNAKKILPLRHNRLEVAENLI